MRGRIEALRKIEDVAHGRGAEGIDRLRVVADHGQAPPRGPQRQHDLALQRVGVLVFVDQQMIEARGDLGGDRRARSASGRNRAAGRRNRARSGAASPRHRRRTARAAPPRAPPPRETICRASPELAARVDDARIDRKAGRLGREALLRVAEARFVARPVHQVGRILAVVDGELRVEAEARSHIRARAARRWRGTCPHRRASPRRPPRARDGGRAAARRGGRAPPRRGARRSPA